MGFEGMTIGAFLDELASNSPAPGGGSVAALQGAQSAALVEMVGALTLGKKGYDDVQEQVRAIMGSAAEERRHLTALADEDTAAFNDVMGALRLPKGTDEEKAVRSEAVQAAFKRAAQVPLDTAGSCLRVLTLSRDMARVGNRHSITDAGGAALSAWAALELAKLNVRINLGSIRDEAFVAGLRLRLEELDGRAILDETIAAVEAVIRG